MQFRGNVWHELTNNLLQLSLPVRFRSLPQQRAVHLQLPTDRPPAHVLCLLCLCALSVRPSMYR